MTDTSDSFVQEVSEELRKDQLTGYARKYGWIVVAVVLGVVGTTAYLEYERSQTEAAAKEKGELFLSALNDADPEARTAALGEIATRDEEAAALATFLHANGLLAADNEEAALNALDALATDATRVSIPLARRGSQAAASPVLGALAAPVAWHTAQLLLYLSMSGSAKAAVAHSIRAAAKMFFMRYLIVGCGTQKSRKLLIAGEKSCGIIYEMPTPKKAIPHNV